jgi:replicative DNA helicase
MDNTKNAGQLAQEALLRISQGRFTLKDSINSIPSGFDFIDDITGGFKNKNLTVFACSEFGSGAFLTSMLEKICKKGICAGLFSFKMSFALLGLGLLAKLSGIPFSKLKSGMLQKEEEERLNSAISFLSEKNNFPLIMENCRFYSFEELSKSIGSKTKNDGLKIAFIDSLSLMRQSENQNEIFAESKKLAEELNIPIVFFLSSPEIRNKELKFENNTYMNLCETLIILKQNSESHDTKTEFIFGISIEDLYCREVEIIFDSKILDFYRT